MVNAGLAPFLDDIARAMPSARVLRDTFSRITHGADASCYRLTPEVVLLAETEAEVAAICAAATHHRVPITFRAAGTSLSGQGVTDSVLVKLGRKGWRTCETAPDRSTIRLGPAMIGGQVNARLARHDRKIGPDPASIGAAMIGGIIANNSSGMCCGTEQNSYRTLRSMRLILADGTLVDTADVASRAAFAASHGALLAALADMADEVASDPALAALIRRKFAIKNTTGYALNALVDFSDPFDILSHLIVGSEGTLGFVGEVTLATVPEPRRKAAALVLFPDMEAACGAAIALKTAPVSAVEVMDFASLQSVIGRPGIPASFAELAPGTSALLIDIRADDDATLDGHGHVVASIIAAFAPLEPAAFSADPVVYGNYWNVRKGLLPSVGGLRPTGTTVIVEDVAVPIARLAEAAQALRAIFDRHGYDDAIIFGHALDGNLHFVFPQSFNSDADVARYRALTDDFTRLIAVTLQGSLKAEHGTGRNMAPFVELEWGAAAYALMRRIKGLFDPLSVLNPGVIISDDPEIYLKHLKPVAAVDPLIDKCIECGFCEPVCPSRDLTLTPRQRIVASRAMAEGHTDLAPDYAYAAVDTCAGDGLCSMACPVGIDTGAMMRRQREARHGAVGDTLASGIGRHMGATITAAKVALGAAAVARGTIGNSAMGGVTGALRAVTGGASPQWTPFLPRPARNAPVNGAPDGRPRVVLFTSCVNAAMGPAPGAPDSRDLWQVTGDLFRRAGYDVVHVSAAETACCGMPFQSKGFPDQARASAERLRDALRDASDNGAIPVVCDTSPCSRQMLAGAAEGLRLLDIAPALATLVLPRLTILRKRDRIALHITCSTRRMGLDGVLTALARACASDVILPEDIQCCGFAGDKGFSQPELNASALALLRDQLPADCTQGFSTSRTCEIGLSTHSGRHYQSVAYLLDWCSDPAMADRPAPVALGA